MSYLKNNRRLISFFLLFTMVFQMLPSGVALALTSGPSQPEVQSFQPVGASDLVDLFSGDFSYNIPLFELPGPNGGYPFNLAYQAGISTDQEASWVGLGWNLQPGAINRQMRGLPDEFDGTDQIETKMSMAPNVTVGIGLGATVELFGADGLSLGIGFTAYQNNYKGAGYSIDGSLGFSKSSTSGNTTGIGLNFSLDGDEGISLSPSLSLASKNVNFGLGLGYQSKEGLTGISIDAGIDRRWSVKNQYGQEKNKRFSIGGGTSLSFTHPGYTPQITTPMHNSSLSATLKAGGAWWGIFGAPYVTGFYNEQRLATDKRWIPAPAFGYLHYHKSNGVSTALMDVNREKDGIVTSTSPNLPIPSLTYDIYSVTGQGISGMYRPFRNDYGVARDQTMISESNGGSAGIDFGPALTHAGANLSINYARSASGVWNNPMTARTAFAGDETGNLYEAAYFKLHGESTIAQKKSENLGGERAVRVKLTPGNASPDATTQMEVNGREPSFEMPAVNKGMPRQERNQPIQPFTNQQIMNGTNGMLPHFNIRFLDENGTESDFVRSGFPLHHTAAFTSTTTEGLRYNYGIPAYNHKQEEIVFSALKGPSDVNRVSIIPSSTPGIPADDEPRYDIQTSHEKYLKRVKTPPYAHSYLLTSILGPDYVDVTGDGVTPDDLGYWVKFTYQRTATQSNPFKWRDPFSKAHLNEGWKSDPRDDKGSFVYGEKEIWYLRKAETKSHIATFTMSVRDDGKGVAQKLQNTDATGQSLRKLDRITLYTRFAGETKPIKVVRFAYDYSLCPATFNSSVTDGNPLGGKLTLKKLWFEYGGSQRGSFNPYVFHYPTSTGNPAYGVVRSDRWGTYKPDNSVVSNFDFPYTGQDPARKSDIDQYAAAWSLQRIDLPSGGTILINYEADDYGYVQHKQAMQMVEVIKPDDPVAPTFNLSDGNLKVRFKLEKPIDKTVVTDAPTWQTNEVKKYLDLSTPLYFKFMMALRTSTENANEYISGYVDINEGAQMKLELDGSNRYVYGSFHVKAERGFNPFSLRAWQHLRTNQPELANPGGKLQPTTSASDQIKQIQSTGSIFGQIKNMFTGFNTGCANRGWGRQVSVGKSWIRLKSPDKIKYGGGLRVKQVTIKDNWQNDEEGVYGQVYEYTTQENGETISSGVASYEPFIGGDENALRYAKRYTESVPLRATNNLFFEYPVNESHYPGAQVGYSKVTVTSLASAALAGKTLAEGQSVFPSGTGVGYGTSGQTIHEFYTARDFPVITDETDKDNRPYRLSVPVPFIGSITISKLTASQGYSIVTNDMHGKPKKVSTYRQSKSGAIEPEPISWVKYNYASSSRYYQQERVNVLQNQFVDSDDGTLRLATATDNSTVTRYALGQEVDFFTDMRQFEDNAYTGGVRVNVDVLFFFFFTLPAFVPWPSASMTENQLRTTVTNKTIYKSGVLESVEAYDGGSLVKTKNEKWDKQTGAVVLTSVNNNFDAPVFSYNILAHRQYQGMGAACQNIGLTYTAINVQAVPNQANYYQLVVKETLPEGSLFAGDEVLLYANTTTPSSPLARAVYVGDNTGTPKWYCEQLLTATSYKVMIVRSGYRNQLSVAAGSISGLEDPSRKGAVVRFSKTISVPK